MSDTQKLNDIYYVKKKNNINNNVKQKETNIYSIGHFHRSVALQVTV